MDHDGENSKLWNVELAKNFYAAHEIAIARAAAQPKAADRHFKYSADEFDDWAVGAGYLQKAVRHAKTVVEGNGLARERQKLRSRLNRAGLKADGLVRGFQVDARSRCWRVVLAEKHKIDWSSVQADGLSKLYSHVHRYIDHVKLAVREDANLDDQERMMAITRVDTLLGHILCGIAQVKFVRYQLDPGSLSPDMRKLGRDMGKLVDEAFLGKPTKRRTKPTQMRLPGA